MGQASIGASTVVSESYVGAFAARAAAEHADAHAVHTSLELIDELYEYNHWIFTKVRPFISGAVCEVGGGIGNITQFLLNQPHVTCLEPYPPSLQRARARFADHRNVAVEPFLLQDCPREGVAAGSFDSIVCLNVLEHIEDDVEALRIMRALSRPGGRVVILVPAHMSAFGSLDRSFGHWRRYNRRSLRRAFAAAGLSVAASSYMNAIGYFGWIWEGCVRRRTTLSRQAARTFNHLVPFLDAFERLIRFPFGQSLVMVGTPE
ncbi:MAG: class I SAM-dependent methyltransferase [Phycisphaerae bacterium]